MFNPHRVAREAIEKHGALQKVGELAGLLALLVDHAPEVVLEIGADAGGTLWAWQQLPSVRRVLAVDLPQAGFHSGRSLDSHGVEVVYGDSHDHETRDRVLAALGWELAGNECDLVDFLFIDGDHSFAGVKQDYDMYRLLVRDGGLIAFHDILRHPNMPFVEVDMFWRQLGRVGPKDEIVTDPQTWGGIGVLYVGADAAVAR